MCESAHRKNRHLLRLRFQVIFRVVFRDILCMSTIVSFLSQMKRMWSSCEFCSSGMTSWKLCSDKRAPSAYNDSFYPVHLELLVYWRLFALCVYPAVRTYIAFWAKSTFTTTHHRAWYIMVHVSWYKCTIHGYKCTISIISMPEFDFIILQSIHAAWAGNGRIHKGAFQHVSLVP